MRTARKHTRARTRHRSERMRVTTKAFMTYLKYWRMNRGLTQHQIAKRLGISQGAYCDYEKGFRKPRPDIHVRLAEVIQRPVEELTSKIYRIDEAAMKGIGAR